MNFVRLRESLRPQVVALKDAGTHQTLPSICGELGLPVLPDEGTKRERVTCSFNSLPDAELPQLAERLLAMQPPSPDVRNNIQDILWEAANTREIPKRSRLFG